LSLPKKDQIFVIIATTAGGVIEWYELFLYVYWAPLISKLFFSSDSSFSASINTLFVFFIGFLARPIGGLVFGHVGDRYGRKVSFIRSMILITLPSFAMGLLPSVEIGIFAPIILGTLRFLQGLPAGGELPGAMCYLAESAPKSRRSFICSFSFFGPQIGVIISMLECYFFEKYMPHDFLVNWGWRISFIIGGLLGLVGFYIRGKLKETPAFLRLEENKKVLHKPITESILRHKKEICIGFFASILDVIGFYMFSVFLGIYFNKVLKISTANNLLITACTLILSTITLPFLGKLGDKYKMRRLLIGSALGMIIFSYPFYMAASYSSVVFTTILELILMLLLNVQFALLPCLLAELFPTSTRYTGIGMSFNLCDSVVGGLTPLLALLLTNFIGDVATFTVFIVFASLVSLITFILVKENQYRKINFN
jgi:MHS family proline/betaine transporter-like MFS transporter